MTNFSFYNNNATLVAIVIVIYCLNPVGGILLATLFTLSDSPKQSNTWLKYLFVMMAIYMGLLNATKIPASDQVNYMNAYNLVPSQSLWKSLINIYGEKYIILDGSIKEIGYGALNVIGYITSFGYYPLFILEFSVLLYMLCLISVKRLFIAIRPKNWLFLSVTAAYIMCFFSQYFNLTIHLQRQEIATAVMLYGIVDYCVVEKYTWKKFLIPLLSVTLHTSVGFFLPLFTFRWITHDKITKKKLIICFFIIAVLIGGSSILASSLISRLGGSYALMRMAEAGSSTEDSFNYSFILFFSVPLILIAFKNIFINKNNEDRRKEYLFYLFYLSLSLLFLSTPDATMQYRYFMMSYSFWPFMIPLLFRKKSIFASVILSCLCIFLFFRFYITFEDMAWKYTTVDNALTCNIVSLFLKNPF